jgi:hypothetical protein
MAIFGEEPLQLQCKQKNPLIELQFEKKNCTAVHALASVDHVSTRTRRINNTRIMQFLFFLLSTSL